MSNIFIYALIISGFINLVHLAMYLIGANIYDIRQFRTKSKKIKSSNIHPLVTVLIPAHNEELGIEKTLLSVCRSSVRKLQIIVINDASKDSTAKKVRTFIKSHSNRNIRLISLKNNRGKASALNYALKKYVQGEFVMTLDADSIIDKYAIKNTLKYFSDSKVAGVAANVRIKQHNTPVGLLQMFEHMIGYRSKKFYTVANCEFIVGGVASTYRYAVLKNLKWYDTDTQTEDIGLSIKISASGNKNYRLVYAADVLAMTEGVQSSRALFKQRYRWKLGMLQNLFKYKYLMAKLDKKYTKSLTLYRLPMAILGELMLITEPLLLGYIIYLSLSSSEPGFFFGAYLTIVIYLSFVIWHDEHLGIIQRIKLSVYFPFMYFIFYIMNAVQLVAITRCLIDPNKVMLKKNVSSTWISPERVGSAT